MKKIFLSLAAALVFLLPCEMSAQFNLSRAVSAAKKGVQALTLSDAQINEYLGDYVQQLDSLNPVAKPGTKYADRLAKLTEGMTSVDGIPLNFKVYEVVDVNAFACADGSVRVFAGLMDIMSDDEVLGVIGHEIGHVAHRDTKRAFKQALLTSALKDAAASASSKVATLSDSQIGAISENLASAQYSQKQEREADDYGYEFIKSHGKNPWAMSLAFQKLLSMQEGAPKSSKLNQLFSTHPDLKNRIKRMEERAKKDGIAKPEK